MLNAVIYARFSDHSQREESIEGQIRICMEYAKQHGYTVIDQYIDRALTAKTDNRPAFQKMIADSKKSTFQIILVYQLDRFARNRHDSAVYKNILKKNGVKVVSAKENISDDASGIFLEGVLESMAEYYSEELAEKIRRGQHENALKCKNNGGGIPLGYILNHQKQVLEIDPLTAPIVVEIYERYANGETARAIANSLNERGIKTQKGASFHDNSFNRILRNRKYIGEYSYRDIVIPGGVPAILSEELFQQVQERINLNKHSRARAKANEEYLLSTKLYCGRCGTLMVGDAGTSHTGTIHYYYKCGSAKRKTGCNKKAVKKYWIEELVVRLVMEYILVDDVIDQIAKQVVEYQKNENPTLPLMHSQLKDIQKKIANILKAVEDGMYSIERPYLI